MAPKANPAMLEMFRDRDESPLRQMVPWAGKFAGKYLTGAVQVLRVWCRMECSSFVNEAAVATSDAVGTQTFTDFLIDVETDISPPLAV